MQQRIFDQTHDVILWFRNGSIGAQPKVGGLDTIVHPNGSNLNFHKVWLHGLIHPRPAARPGLSMSAASPIRGRMTYILNRLISIALTRCC